MASKAQLKKKYADELAQSTAPGPLLQVIYALSKDATLQGAELVAFEGYRGKRPAGRQIAKAKELLGIRKAGKRRAPVEDKTDPKVHLRSAVQGYQRIVDRAKAEKREAKRRYAETLAEIERRAKAARKAVRTLKQAAAES